MEIAVVGGGFSGLGAAIRLLQEGFDDLVVLERAERVGGTWRDNTYPGCACDVPSDLYSFSFAPEPGWTRRYSPAEEIEAYLERCVDRFAVRPRLHLGTEVTATRWDDVTRRWQVETSRGTLTARFLVAGPGPLAEPNLPDIPGLETFRGTVFHSARWDHGHDLTGRRVAVVGTGASAIQIVPAIAPFVEHLVLLQRTPAWIVPRRDRPRPPWLRSLYARVPAAQRLSRAAEFLLAEAQHPAWSRPGPARRIATRLADRHRERQVPDPALRATLTPATSWAASGCCARTTSSPRSACRPSRRWPACGRSGPPAWSTTTAWSTRWTP